MNMQFIGKLPIPQEIKSQYPLSEEAADIKLARDKEIARVFSGEDDRMVPCAMSRENFEACASRKRLVTIPGAGHGLAYAVEPDRYVEELYDFFGPECSYQK